MSQFDVIRRRALGALLAAAVFSAAPGPRAMAADDSSLDARSLAHQTQRQVNDAGQYYLAWWIPENLAESLLQDSAGLSQAQVQQLAHSLDPFVVFVVTRGEEGAKHLENVQPRADLIAHSRASVDGQALGAAIDPNDAAAMPALDALRPIITPLLGRNGYGLEFLLYRYPPGMHALDPSMNGNIDYLLYRKHFVWNLPVWNSLLGAAASTARPTPVPVPATAAPAATIPAAAPPAAPAMAVPTQRRKIDPTSGEEFPERYNYNPYTGQKLVSQ